MTLFPGSYDPFSILLAESIMETDHSPSVEVPLVPLHSQCGICNENIDQNVVVTACTFQSPRIPEKLN